MTRKFDLILLIIKVLSDLFSVYFEFISPTIPSVLFLKKMEADDLNHTVYHSVKFRFEWSVPIPFLSTTDRNGQSLQSPNFYSTENHGRRWKLQLYDKSSDISICACHYNCEEKNVDLSDPITVKMSVLDTKGHTTFKQMLRSKSAQIEFLIPKKCLLHFKGELSVVNGCYIFYCKIIYRVKKDGIDCVAQCAAEDERAFDKMQFSKYPTVNDVIVNVRGREFPAHKNILCNKSEFFRRMLSEHSSEGNLKMITIENFEPDVFHQLLRYMYTGRLNSETMGTMAAELLHAADYYVIEELKIECRNHLLRHMSALNCIELILRCDKLDPESENLKNATKEAAAFFRRSSPQVMTTDQWENLVKENPRLLCKQSIKFKSLCFFNE
jgi:speckle-type POZ protein